MVGLNANAPEVNCSRLVTRCLEFADGSEEVRAGAQASALAEHRTGGLWIDGKAIFRRVFELVPAANSSTLDLTGDIPTWEKWTNAYWSGREALQFIAGFENAGGANGLRFNLVNSILAVFHQGITPTEITAVVEYTKV